MRRGLPALALLGLAGSAEAHSFGQLYTLPVPFALYAWASLAALLLSFLAAAWLMTAHPAARTPVTRIITPGHLPLLVLRGLALGMLLLTIATGLLGPRDAYLNFSMTAFWIGFVLAFAYLTAIIGDLYAWISPWQSLAILTGTPAEHGLLRYPTMLGCWPALMLYMVFIWLELFGHASPAGLAHLLIGYSLLTLFGCWLFGRAAWLRHGEFFSVFLRLTARMAPVAWLPPAQPGGRPRLHWRVPFSGLLDEPAANPGELVFILFMLSATAFDGLHVTQVWDKLYWESLYGALQPWLSSNIVIAYPTLKRLHVWWETGMLLLSPLLYLSVYLLCLALARRLTGSTLGLRTLALRFAPSLLPIALVYHVSHYYTLVLTQGTQLWWLASDPFGRGWNLLGNDNLPGSGSLPAMGTIWHTQVGLILGGHIVSVCVAHREALRSFGTARLAMLSQLPLLALMMAFTVFGLWILAQPIGGGM